MTVTPQCIAAAPGSFITDEEWLVDTTDQYWIESGFIKVGSGTSINGLTAPGQFRFWGDNRPSGGGFHGHVVTSDESLTKTGFYITSEGSNSYEIETHIAGGQYYYSYLNSDSMNPGVNQYGSEVADNMSFTHSEDTTVEYINGSANTVAGPGSSYAVSSFSGGGHFTWVTVPTSFKAAVWSGC